MRKIAPQQKKFMKLLESYGYYSYPMVGAMPPYDLLSHSIRGMTAPCRICSASRINSSSLLNSC